MVAVRLYATDSQFSTLLYSTEVSVRLNTMTAATAQSDGSFQLIAMLADDEPVTFTVFSTRLAR